MCNKSFVTFERLLDSAQLLFVNESFDNIAMAEIAQEMNVNKGGICYHFTNKEALFLCMMERYGVAETNNINH